MSRLDWPAPGDARMRIGLACADFDWHDFDEMDQVTGNGSVELQPDGSLEAEFAYDNGDESTLKARPW